MCGIIGIVAKNSNADIEGTMSGLVDGVSHRGPDDRGQYISPDRKCFLGHTRLAILDLSSAGHQPMLDEVTGNAIVYNGEIYNFSTLRNECEEDGYRFHSGSDTEVILALYRKYGVDCLRFLHGMFSFAIWDEREKCLLFARDRVGKKPFNYAISSKGFIFCSEIDPLARHPWTDRDLDTQALDFYLHLQYVPAPLSIYRGIRKLPPAHYGLLDSSGLRIEPYWHFDYRNKLDINESDALDAFEEKLSDAVKLRMVADVPVGALLSGGVDSSVIVAMMAKVADSSVHTYSVGFSQAEFDESGYAKQAADLCGTQHRAVKLDSPDIDLLPTIIKRYGEPYGDCSALPSFAVCAAARQELKVVLNGDGGDELLGGYPRYSLPNSTIRLASWIRRIHPMPLVDPVSWLGGRGRFPWKKIRRLSQDHLLLPDAGPFTMYSSHWTDRLRRELLDDDSVNNNLPQWRAGWFRKARLASENPIDSMLWLDNHTYLPDDLLVKMDIASMHCGLEARSPLLDHELIEFCARLPVNCKVKDGTGKYLLKKLAERYFPREFVHRSKMGFGTPLVAWMRGPLNSLLNDVLRDPVCMWPLDHATVDRFRRRFIDQGDDSEVTCLWSLLMYGLWRRYGAPAESIE
ncbi:asparagine synthase (glutamine-hydrolyzing) [Solemya velesiana gill symbiont]|uniref:asparagine synthase (glutamine-hydrolyzing) n=1 Tax=Solemya velesiana gill symbiont TaxID=1918948 RepID=A0A1T2KSS7_9GAMM|nr:asparagine synthase (glutamine-hydrolyzing) [Solemya velesiana gill symbiont]OOZ35760.1 asparagine synthase (glutamine-hydrolyzing) [Solemya velesiana gill symbiont]